MTKTKGEINEKIREGKAVVVTTGTFGSTCSSGAYFNIGHAKLRIKLSGGHVIEELVAGKE